MSKIGNIRVDVAASDAAYYATPRMTVLPCRWRL